MSETLGGIGVFPMLDVLVVKVLALARIIDAGLHFRSIAYITTNLFTVDILVRTQE